MKQIINDYDLYTKGNNKLKYIFDNKDIKEMNNVIKLLIIYNDINPNNIINKEITNKEITIQEYYKENEIQERNKKLFETFFVEYNEGKFKLNFMILYYNNDDNINSLSTLLCELKKYYSNEIIKLLK